MHVCAPPTAVFAETPGDQLGTLRDVVSSPPAIVALVWWGIQFGVRGNVSQVTKYLAYRNDLFLASVHHVLRNQHRPRGSDRRAPSLLGLLLPP